VALGRDVLDRTRQHRCHAVSVQFTSPRLICWVANRGRSLPITNGTNVAGLRLSLASLT
jgi:hypothetical protein